ncbi:hypothetical protein M0802_004364 [Mischocyttarus mexicanus]|nr:hypothetical protein M0802_004364 [Mischocyttarus mexicanus]
MAIKFVIVLSVFACVGMSEAFPGHAHSFAHFYGPVEGPGKHVAGEYTIKEPGGNTRIVKYHSDPHGGFFAHVYNTGGNNHEGGTYGGHGNDHY